jgi:hypothetical protein
MSELAAGAIVLDQLAAADHPTDNGTIFYDSDTDKFRGIVLGQALAVSVGTPISKLAICPFGGKSDSLGSFLIANGKSTDADTGTKAKTRQPIGLNGKLVRLAYKTKDGDTTTQMKIHVNGSVEATVLLVNMNANSGGVEAIDVDVLPGDYVEIEWDAGQKPGECTMYFIQEAS